MPTPSAVEIRNLSFSYGTKTILENFNLSLQSGKIYCLVGSSGSGKTTTMQLINGLLTPNRGEIFLNGEKLDFSQAEKVRRKMGYSIQGSGLFPHMSLYENLTIIARKQGWEKRRIEKRVRKLCELMTLSSDPAFLSKKPREISGGQQQRVGIARALFLEPSIMLMDEPFSALDPITRQELQREFLNLQHQLHLTIVLVTHDLSEAFRMADQIVLLNKGRIEQMGKPSQFLLAPASPFVKGFVESHSPGNLLKEIFLYSVMGTQVFTTEERNGSFVLRCLESGNEEVFTDIHSATRFLKSQNQTAHYWLDTGVYKYSEIIDGEKSSLCLQSTQHILNGMSTLLESGFSALPVLNDEKRMVGVFSREALNAL